MNWDQKALEAWLEESARKDEDALTLQKYTRSDEGKVKVSNFHISICIITILRYKVGISMHHRGEFMCLRNKDKTNFNFS